MTRSQPVFRAVVIVCAAALALAACSDDGTEDTTETTPRAGSESTDVVLESIADDVIVPAYEELVDALSDLHEAVESLCEAPAPAALEQARTDWRAVDLAWARTQGLDVGPAMERRLMASLGFEARPEAVTELLAGDGALDPAALAQEGAAVRGISAIEVALFAEGADQLAAPDGARRCEYAASATELSLDASRLVLDDWDGGFRATFATGVDGSAQSSVSALLNEVTFALQLVDDQGLRSLVEAGSADALPANRDDGPAGTRVAHLRSTLAGAAAALTGPDGPDGAEGGVIPLLLERDADAAERLQAAVVEAEALVGQLPDAAADVFEDPAQLQAAADAVAALKVLVGTEVASHLGVTIGFSDADGDS